MTAMEEEVDDRFAGIDIDSLLNRTEHRPMTYGRKKALYEAPEFIQRLNGEETVMEGQSLCIDCKVRGFPVPTLRWFKDDEEILDHPRIHVESTGTGGYSLIIDNVHKGDEAAYRCRAENMEGACSSFFFLSVKAKPKSQKKKDQKSLPNRRMVSFPPMFATIVEKVEEEEKLGKELQHLPPSPMTDFYYALTLKGRQSWPAFVGDWAFVNGGHSHKRRTEDGDDDDDDVNNQLAVVNGDHKDANLGSSNQARLAARRSLRRGDLAAQAEAKKQRMEEDDGKKRGGGKEKIVIDENEKKRLEEERKKKEDEMRMDIERKRRAETMRLRKKAREERLQREKMEQEKGTAKEEQEEEVAKQKLEEKNREEERLQQEKQRLEEERKRTEERKKEELKKIEEIKRKEEEIKRKEEQKKGEELNRKEHEVRKRNEQNKIEEIKRREEETKKKEDQKKVEEQKRKEEQDRKINEQKKIEEKKKKDEELRKKEEQKKADDMKRKESEIKKQLEEKAKKEEEIKRSREEAKKKEEETKKKKEAEELAHKPEEFEKQRRQQIEERKQKEEEEKLRKLLEDRKKQDIKKKEEDDKKKKNEAILKVEEERKKLEIKKQEDEKAKLENERKTKEAAKVQNESQQVKQGNQKSVLQKFAKHLDAELEPNAITLRKPSAAIGLKSSSVKTTTNQQQGVNQVTDSLGKDKASIIPAGEKVDSKNQSNHPDQTMGKKNDIPKYLQNLNKVEKAGDGAKLGISTNKEANNEINKETNKASLQPWQRRDNVTQKQNVFPKDQRLEELRDKEKKRMEELQQEEQRKLEKMKQSNKSTTVSDGVRGKEIQQNDLRAREQKQIEDLRRKEKQQIEELKQKELKQREELHKREEKQKEELKRKEELKLLEELKRKEEMKLKEEMKRKEDLKLKEQMRLKEEIKLKEDIKRKEEIKMKEELKQKEELKLKEEIKMKEELKLREEQKRKDELKIKEEIKRKEELKLKEELKRKEELKIKEETNKKLKHIDANKVDTKLKPTDLKAKIGVKAKELQQLAELKAKEQAQIENVKLKERKQNEDLHLKQQQQQTKGTWLEKRMEMEKKRNVAKEQEDLRVEQKKEQMRKDQLWKQHEEEVQKRQKKEEEDKQRSLRIKQKLPPAPEEDEFSVKVHKRDYSFSDLQKILETQASGNVAVPEERKFVDDVLEKHEYSINNLQKTFDSLSKSSGERQSREKDRRSSVEDTELWRMKRAGSVTGIRESYTNSLERPNKKETQSKPKDEEILKRGSSITELRQQLLEVSKGQNDSKKQANLPGHREAEITIHHLKVDSPLVNSESGRSTRSPTPFRLSPSPSSLLQNDQQEQKPVTRTQVELAKITSNVAAKRASFHDMLTQKQGTHAKGELSELAKKRMSFHGRDSYGSIEIPTYERAANWSDDIDKPQVIPKSSKVQRSEVTKAVLSQSTTSPASLPTTARDETNADSSTSTVRPFIYNSARTTARRSTGSYDNSSDDDVFDDENLDDYDDNNQEPAVKKPFFYIDEDGNDSDISPTKSVIVFNSNMHAGSTGHEVAFLEADFENMENNNDLTCTRKEVLDNTGCRMESKETELDNLSIFSTVDASKNKFSNRKEVETNLNKDQQKAENLKHTVEVSGGSKVVVRTPGELKPDQAKQREKEIIPVKDYGGIRNVSDTASVGGNTQQECSSKHKLTLVPDTREDVTPSIVVEIWEEIGDKENCSTRNGNKQNFMQSSESLKVNKGDDTNKISGYSREEREPTPYFQTDELKYKTVPQFLGTSDGPESYSRVEREPTPYFDDKSKQLFATCASGAILRPPSKSLLPEPAREFHREPTPFYEDKSAPKTRSAGTTKHTLGVTDAGVRPPRESTPFYADDTSKSAPENNTLLTVSGSLKVSPFSDSSRDARDSIPYYKERDSCEYLLHPDNQFRANKSGFDKENTREEEPILIGKPSQLSSKAGHPVSIVAAKPCNLTPGNNQSTPDGISTDSRAITTLGSKIQQPGKHDLIKPGEGQAATLQSTQDRTASEKQEIAATKPCPLFSTLSKGTNSSSTPDSNKSQPKKEAVTSQSLSVDISCPRTQELLAAKQQVTSDTNQATASKSLSKVPKLEISIPQLLVSQNPKLPNTQESYSSQTKLQRAEKGKEVNKENKTKPDSLEKLNKPAQESELKISVSPTATFLPTTNTADQITRNSKTFSPTPSDFVQKVTGASTISTQATSMENGNTKLPISKSISLDQRQQKNVTAIKHAENVTTVKHGENVTAVKHAETVTPIKQAENVTAMKYAENVTPIKQAENVTAMKYAENVTPIKLAETVAPIQHAKNVAPVKKQAENVTAIKQAENVTAIKHVENKEPIKHAENVTPIKHAENKAPIKHAENVTPIKRAETVAPIKQAENVTVIKHTVAAINQKPSELVVKHAKEVSPRDRFINRANAPLAEQETLEVKLDSCPTIKLARNSNDLISPNNAQTLAHPHPNAGSSKKDPRLRDPTSKPSSTKTQEPKIIDLPPRQLMVSARNIYPVEIFPNDSTNLATGTPPAEATLKRRSLTSGLSSAFSTFFKSKRPAEDLKDTKTTAAKEKPKQRISSNDGKRNKRKATQQGLTEPALPEEPKPQVRPLVLSRQTLAKCSPFGAFTLEGFCFLFVLTIFCLYINMPIEKFVCYVLAAFYTFCVVRILGVMF